MGNFLTTLRERDPHNQSIAVILCILFAQFKHFKFLSILHQYTFWNVTLTLTNFAFRLEYERILFCNSMGIISSYRTASADLQVHDDLVEHSRLDPVTYFFGDALVHFFPPLILGYYLISRQKYVRPQHGWFSVLGQVYFAYSQAGKLDVSGVYRPHDSLMSWSGGILASVMSPFIINNAIKGRYNRAIVFAMLCFIPFLIKKLGYMPWPRKLIDMEADTIISSWDKTQNDLCSVCKDNLCLKCKDFVNAKKLVRQDD